MAILSAPGRETFVVLNVVNLAIGPVETDVRRQKMDDIVFSGRQADIDIIPVGPMDGRRESKLAAYNMPRQRGSLETPPARSRRAGAIGAAGRCPKWSEASSRGR